MRRTLVAVSLVGIFAASSAFAQDNAEETKVQVVGQTADAPVNAIGIQYHSNLAFTTPIQYQPGVTIAYERAFSDMMSLAIEPGLLFNTGYVTFGLDLELRFHLMGESLNGLYVGPTAGFWLGAPPTGILPGFDAGAVVGYSYLINNMVQVGLGVGLTYTAVFVAGGMSGALTLPIRATVAFAF